MKSIRGPLNHNADPKGRTLVAPLKTLLTFIVKES